MLSTCLCGSQCFLAFDERMLKKLSNFEYMSSTLRFFNVLVLMMPLSMTETYIHVYIYIDIDIHFFSEAYKQQGLREFVFKQRVMASIEGECNTDLRIFSGLTVVRTLQRIRRAFLLKSAHSAADLCVG